LRQHPQEAGLRLDAANASAEPWKQYFMANPGAQQNAVEALTKTSFSIVAKYETHITQDFFGNIVRGNFTPHP